MSQAGKTETLSAIYKPVYELFKQLQDYLKVLITLNTATVLITLTLIERIFRFPKILLLLFISFCCFSVSLVASLLVMFSITKFYDLLARIIPEMIILADTDSIEIAGFNDKKQSLQDKVDKFSSGKLNWYKIGNYFYLAGLVFLLIFLGINLFCK